MCQEVPKIKEEANSICSSSWYCLLVPSGNKRKCVREEMMGGRWFINSEKRAFGLQPLATSHRSSLKSFLSTSRALCRKFWIVFPFFICRTNTHKAAIREQPPGREMGARRVISSCCSESRHDTRLKWRTRSSAASHRTLPWLFYGARSHPSSWMWSQSPHLEASKHTQTHSKWVFVHK